MMTSRNKASRNGDRVDACQGAHINMTTGKGWRGEARGRAHGLRGNNGAIVAIEGVERPILVETIDGVTTDDGRAVYLSLSLPAECEARSGTDHNFHKSVRA